MACNCGENWSSMIRTSCSDPASRLDVITALETLAGNCCVGTVNTAGLRPTDNASVAYAEAFPDGVSICNCDCIYIYNATDNETFVNCSGDYTNDIKWEMISTPTCFGALTTISLSPDLDAPSRIASIAEAYPDGLDSQCDVYYITREDGVLCYSTDGGASFSCLQPVQPDQVYEVVTPYTVLGSSSASIVMSGIPSTYRHLYFIGNLRSDGTGGSGYEGAVIRFNADTGANYQRQYTLLTDVTTSAVAQINQTSFNIVNGVTDNVGSNLATTRSTLDFTVSNYENTTYHKNVHGRSLGMRANTAAAFQMASWHGRWVNTGAVTSITITPAVSANFVAGSSYALYGIRGIV